VRTVRPVTGARAHRPRQRLLWQSRRAVLVHYSKARGATPSRRNPQAAAAAPKGRCRPAAGGRPHILAKRVRAIVGDRLDILGRQRRHLEAASIEDTTIEDFDNLFAVNVARRFFLVQQLLPALCKAATSSSRSSIAAHASVGTLSAYAATKGAVDTLVKHFASALGPRGIRVNAVRPRRGGDRTCRTSPRRGRRESRSACKR